MVQQCVIGHSLPITAKNTDHLLRQGLTTDTDGHQSDVTGLDNREALTESTNATSILYSDASVTQSSTEATILSADSTVTPSTPTTVAQSTDDGMTQSTNTLETQSTDASVTTSTNESVTQFASEAESQDTTDLAQTSQPPMIMDTTEEIASNLTTSTRPELVTSFNTEILINESKEVFKEIEKLVHNGSISLEAIRELNALPDIRISTNAESYIIDTLSKAHSVLDRAHHMEFRRHRRSSVDVRSREPRSADGHCQFCDTCNDRDNRRVDPVHYSFDSRFDICPVQITSSFDQSRMPMVLFEASCACYYGRNRVLLCEDVEYEIPVYLSDAVVGANRTFTVSTRSL